MLVAVLAVVVSACMSGQQILHLLTWQDARSVHSQLVALLIYDSVGMHQNL